MSGTSLRRDRVGVCLSYPGPSDTMPNILTLTQLTAYIRKLCDTDTQKDVAEQLGVTPSYLNDILAGHRKPGPKLLAGLGMREMEPRYEVIH